MTDSLTGIDSNKVMGHPDKSAQRMDLPEAPARWFCRECAAVSDTPLEGRNPFDPNELVYGCPACKAVGTLEAACQMSGCDRPSVCGVPDVGGFRYMRLCGYHYLLLQQDRLGFYRG